MPVIASLKRLCAALFPSRSGHASAGPEVVQPPATASVDASLLEQQIEALLYGDMYEWAVRSGAIRRGEALEYSKVLKVRRGDVLRYLQNHPVPGIDIQRAQYYNIHSEGPTWHQAGGRYIIGWLERGGSSQECGCRDEKQFRQQWITFLVASMGLPD